MSKLYYYETLDEFEKELIDKTIILDTMYTTNLNLFECFVRIVRTIMIWVMIVSTTVIFFHEGFKTSLMVFLGLLLIYIIGAILMSWVKYNYNLSYKNSKIVLIENMLVMCKEFQETKYEDWAKNQMIKRFGALVHIEFE